jgi:hypothetical protein
VENEDEYFSAHARLWYLCSDVRERDDDDMNYEYYICCIYIGANECAAVFPSLSLFFACWCISVACRDEFSESVCAATRVRRRNYKQTTTKNKIKTDPSVYQINGQENEVCPFFLWESLWITYLLPSQNKQGSVAGRSSKNHAVFFPPLIRISITVFRILTPKSAR